MAVSGWQDSNLRLSAPKADALTKLNYIPVDVLIGFEPTKNRFAGGRLTIQPQHGV
jgi:hypothetical protein